MWSFFSLLFLVNSFIALMAKTPNYNLVFSGLGFALVFSILHHKG